MKNKLFLNIKKSRLSFHLSVLGKKIKLEEIFRGYSGLLALIWNLPSKQTSLFSLNHLVSDTARIVSLSNGASLRLQSLGAFSVDLSGMGEVSFWSMYAKTNVKLRF